ncbi:MAG TPA: ABC transporter permease [Terriglobia bacterium]|nr:ABC transporter permease [Terriglobia bacterium]
MGNLLQDLRYGLRMLAKNPGFTAVAVLTLALGIGGNSTVFSWVEAVLLHPLTLVRDSGRMVAIETVMPNGEFHTSSYPDYKDYRDASQTFSGMIGFELVAVNTKLESEEQPQRDWGLLVTENYFDVLGVNAARGRTFHAEDNRGAGSDPYIVLSDGYWQRRFGADPGVLGKILEINRRAFTVIGVAPRGFNGTIVGITANYWVPMMMQPDVLPGESLTYRAPTFIHLMGRLSPGASLKQAQAELGTIASRLQREYPETNKDVGISVCPVWKAHYGLQDFLLPVLAFLMVVVVLVLLIACANVANLLLARATAREKETAIRAAMGASRMRLLRQMLAESLLLALLGGAGGVFFALWSSNFLVYFLPPAHLPIGLPLGVDSRILIFTLALSMATALIFGLAPAWQTSRPDLNASLKEGGRTSSAGASQHRLRSLLVVAETALAVVLLAGAGLLIRSLRAAEAAGPGFSTGHVLLTAIDLRGSGYTGDQSAAFFLRLLEQIKALPGVKGASLERFVPLWFTGRGYTRPTIEGYTPRPNEDIGIDYNAVGPNYFALMRIPILFGRELADQDRLEKPLVCVINQTMAERFWPGQNAVGHRLNSWDRWWTVVGVAKDVKYHSMNESPEPFMYFPLLQETSTDANILVKTAGDPRGLLAPVRQKIHALDPSVPILDSDDLAGLLAVSLFANRIAANLAVVLGSLGLLLASVGLYGVLSYLVGQRRHEIGIRMALGARPADVLGLVVKQGMRLVLIGAVLGLGAALAAARLIASLLYGVGSSDPLTFVAVSVVLVAVALLACYLPARRATKVDPMVALRYE